MSKLQERLLGKTAGIERAKEPETKESAGASTPTGAEVSPSPLALSGSSSASSPVSIVSAPGQLSAFRNDAKKYVAQIAERDALIDELKYSTDRKQRIKLADVNDSPYQPRLEYDPQEIDALAKTMAAASQADPIKVRQKQDGRYELISGHRRKRAALSMGWVEIDAIVEVRTDAEAELESMLLVVGNVKLSDYEYANMYRRALDKKYCKTQEGAAHMFGVSQAKVSSCLDMLALPKPIIEMLDAKPSLLSSDSGRVIKQLLKEHPGHLEIIVRGVRRIVEEGATQASLKGWINQAIAQAARNGAQATDNVRTVTREGRSFFTMKKTPRAITVNFKAKGFDDAKFEKDLHAWLKTYANSAESEKEKD